MVSRVLSALISRLSSPRSPGWRFLLVVWSGIFLLALGMFFCRQRVAPLQPRDSVNYICWAERIAATSWAAVLRAPNEEALCKPPLLLTAMAAAVRHGVEAKTAGLVLMLLSFLLLNVALALIAEELWRDWRLTAATMLFTAVCPLVVRFAVQILRDLPYWCLAAWAIWWAMRAAAGKRPWVNWLCSAIFCGLAILTRREGVEFILIVGLWMSFSGWHRQNWRRILLRKVLFAAEFLAVVMLLTLPVEFKMAQWGSRWRAGQFSSIRYYWSRLF